MSPLRFYPATALLMVIAGCALLGIETKKGKLDTPWDASDSESADNSSSAPVLKAALMEANIVRRPANDARIRTLVWEELDESGPMSPEQRQQLNRSGFRVGVAGNSGIWALQSLARETTQVAMSQPAEAQSEDLHTSFQMPVGPSFSLFRNGVTRLEVQNSVDPAVIPVESIPELAGLRQLNQLRCVMQITVDELQDGWALLTVLPQIYSGSNIMRLSVAGNSDQLPVRQNVYPLYEQQFQLKLHRGEVAVIGRYGSDNWNPGRLFFQPDNGSAAAECLLLIRLVGIDHVKGKSDLSVNIGKKYAW